MTNTEQVAASRVRAAASPADAETAATYGPVGPVTFRPSPWHLRARPEWLESSAVAWRSCANLIEDVAGSIDDPVQATYGHGWTGVTANEFAAHWTKLSGDVRQSAVLARSLAEGLERAAGELRAGQRALFGALSQLCGRVYAQVWTDGSAVTFHPEDASAEQFVRAGGRQAARSRADIDGELAACEARARDLAPRWEGIASAWAATAGGVDPFAMPAEATGFGVLRDGNTVIINTGGSGNDAVVISDDAVVINGDAVVINGEPCHGPLLPRGVDVVVRTGAGNDQVAVEPGPTMGVTVLGGADDDLIAGGDGGERILGGCGNDRISGGAGNDRLSGGAGRDYVDGQWGHDTLRGGEGHDVVYGLSGRDTISGGAGRDYLEGGAGADTVYGGAQADVISGGRDADRLRAGAGNDVIYAGAGGDGVLGADALAGGTGTDTAYGKSGDGTDNIEQLRHVSIGDAGQSVVIDGSGAFRERVRADLDLLRSSPTGQRMLAELDDGYPGGTGATLRVAESDADLHREGTVLYDPGRATVYEEQGVRAAWQSSAPVVALYHELGHAYAHANGIVPEGSYTGPDDPAVPGNQSHGESPQPILNYERAVVGLPIDLDGDGRAEPFAPHPEALTENALRRELGLPERTTFGPPPPQQ